MTDYSTAFQEKFHEKTHNRVSIDKNWFAKIDQRKKMIDLKWMMVSCVYGLMKDGELIYIGSANNLLQRITHHYNTKEFDGFIFVKHFDEYGFKLINMEAILIAKYKPKWNKQLPPNNDIYMGISTIKRIYFERQSEVNQFIKKNNLIPALFMGLNPQFLQKDIKKALINGN